MDEPPTPTHPPERHPDDLPPDRSARRQLPRGLMWAGALFVVVLAIASFTALSSDPSATAPPGDDVVHLDPGAPQPFSGGLQGIDPVGLPAPTAPFTTFTGSEASLAGYKGTPVVLNFWSSTCPPCINEMPALEAAHQRYGAKVAFVGMDAPGDSETGARSLGQLTGVTYTLGFDRSGAVSRSVGLVNLPTTILIDRNGTIVHSNVGELKSGDITRLIDEKLQP